MWTDQSYYDGKKELVRLENLFNNETKHNYAE